MSELDARRRREAQRPGWSRISEHVSSELAAALTLTGRSADALLGLTRELARIPMVLVALLAGKIDRAKAEVFARELAGLGDVAAGAVAAAFCALAGSMTTGQLRAALRAMVLSVDPEALKRRAEKGRAEARVEAWQEGSGNAALAGRELPAADAVVADRRITAIARTLQAAGAKGNLDQLRAAVFVALLTGRDPESLLPAATERTGPAGGTDSSGSRLGLAAVTGSIHLTMPVSAWLGQSQAPGEVAGLGPLDADTCRDLAARLAARTGTQWCVSLTNPLGQAVAHACTRSGPGSWLGRFPQSGPSQGSGPSGPSGPSPPAPPVPSPVPMPMPPPPAGRDPGPPVSAGTAGGAWLAALEFQWLELGHCAHSRRVRGYRPSGRLLELIRVRQRTCSFPGCRRPAGRCDCDHTTPFEDGGLTCECNMSPLCRLHHRAKQAPGWQLSQPEPGLLVWTLPHGRNYAVAPAAYPI